MEIRQSCFKSISALEVKVFACKKRINIRRVLSTTFFRSYNSITSLIVSSVGSELKSSIRRKCSYLDKNESRLTFILFKWFSIFDLWGSYEQPNNHFLFLQFFEWILPQLFPQDLLLKVLTVYISWYIIKFHLLESYDQACKDYSNQEYGFVHLEKN